MRIEDDYDRLKKTNIFTILPSQSEEDYAFAGETIVVIGAKNLNEAEQLYRKLHGDESLRLGHSKVSIKGDTPIFTKKSKDSISIGKINGIELLIKVAEQE